MSAAGIIARERGLFGRLTATAIVAAVAEAHGVTVDEIRSKSRQKKHVAARMHACHLIRELVRLSLPRTGYAVRRDHSTVKYSTLVWPARQHHFPKQVRKAALLLEVPHASH